MRGTPEGCIVLGEKPGKYSEEEAAIAASDIWTGLVTRQSSWPQQWRHFVLTSRKSVDQERMHRNGKLRVIFVPCYPFFDFNFSITKKKEEIKSLTHVIFYF